MEEDAYLAAREAIVKALNEGFGAAAEEAGKENAVRAYRSHHGKRSDAFLDETVNACIAEKEMWWVEREREREKERKREYFLFYYHYLISNLKRGGDCKVTF